MKNRAGVTNLLETVDFLTDCLSKRVPSDVIYLDFAKAFDKVSHNLLMVKLEAYGVPIKLLSWIGSFLSNRRQRVVMGNMISRWRPVISGVPQGSVLGPLLFIIYINDLLEFAECESKLFADDAKLLSPVQTSEECEKVQNSLDKFFSLAQESKMRFNEDKCSVIHFGTNNPNQTYYLNGHPLKSSLQERDLGVIISHDLKFGPQVAKAIARANSMIYRIRETLTYLDIKMVDRLYKTLIRPHLEFAVSAWNPSSAYEIECLAKFRLEPQNLFRPLKI